MYQRKRKSKIKGTKDIQREEKWRSAGYEYVGRRLDNRWRTRLTHWSPTDDT